VQNDITARIEAEQTVLHLAYQDSLTRLPNRTRLADVLTSVLDRAQHTGTATALLSIDLDNFKQVNDTHGHSAGDLLLRDVATRLRTAARADDLLARQGGDEFLLLLTDLPPHQAARIAGRTAQQLGAALQQPFVLQQTKLTVTASIGVAVDTAGHQYSTNVSPEGDCACDPVVTPPKLAGPGCRAGCCAFPSGLSTSGAGSALGAPARGLSSRRSLRRRAAATVMLDGAPGPRWSCDPGQQRWPGQPGPVHRGDQPPERRALAAQRHLHLPPRRGGRGGQQRAQAGVVKEGDCADVDDQAPCVLEQPAQHRAQSTGGGQVELAGQRHDHRRGLRADLDRAVPDAGGSTRGSPGARQRSRSGQGWWVAARLSWASLAR